MTDGRPGRARRVRPLTLALAGVVIALPAACALRSHASGVLARYDLEAEPAARWTLPRELDEISGLATDAAGRLFAHDDEQAVVYQLDPAAQRIVKRFAFGRPAIHGDFEGIAIVGDRVILTTSDGVLYVGRAGEDGEAVPFSRFETGIGRYCEIEGLAWDQGAQTLLFACKTPRVRSLKGQLAVFAWSLDQATPVTSPKLRVPEAAVARVLGGRGGFAPSELLLEPRSGHLLLLAAREHAIVELTPAGDVVGAARLRRSLHRQAEGLALAGDGTLLVGDEANGARATLTAYRPVRRP